MAINRIKIAKDKANLAKSLIAQTESTGVFQTYVEVMVFAAALGAKYQKRVPIIESSKVEPSPIPPDYFASNGYDKVINLLAVCETKTQEVLGYNQEAIDERIKVFEEYANGGLEILQEELRGAVDYSERLLLFLSSERWNQKQEEQEFDLTKFLT